MMPTYHLSVPPCPPMAMSHLGVPGACPTVSPCPHGWRVPGQDQGHPGDSNPMLVTHSVPVSG